VAGIGFDRLSARTVETADCSSLGPCVLTPTARPQASVLWEPAWMIDLEPRTSNLEPRTSNLEPRTSNLEPLTSNL
jgi:hypothetical protein